MKIVINRCYGGYGLSHKAVIEYAKLVDIKLYAYISDGEITASSDKNKYRLFVGGKRDGWAVIHYVKRKLKDGEDIDDVGDNDYFSEGDIPRNDLYLVKVVEELGVKANGNYAKLKIVEIPDNVEWQIEKYDGMEWVAEKHRKWL